MAVTFCELFLEFLRRNAMVAVVILAVLFARLLLKKLPKRYAYALWSVVALRMIFSFDIPSFFSIFNVFAHAGHDGVLPESDRMMPVHVIPGNTAGAGQAVWAAPDAVTEASKRIKNVLRYRKPRLISAVVAVLALAVVSLVCLTNASETTEEEESTGLDEKTASVNHERETASDGDNPSDAGNNLDEEISQALEKAGSENAGIKVTSNDLIVTKADLDHDGENEQIVVCEKAEDLYELKVWKQDGTLLWSTEAGTSHTEWNTILIYQNEGEDYLIQYLPAMYQGIGNYTCTMFSLENGQVSEKNTWTVDFDPMVGITGKMRGFFEAVNYLLENSTVLLTTEGGNLVIGPQKATDLQQIYPVNYYLAEVLNEGSYEVVYPLELTFCSGAGGWSTTLTLYEDGHFEGIYEDGEAEWTNEYPRGTAYYCEFSGRFREMKKLNEYSYSMILDDLTYKTEVGKEWIKDGVRYIGSDAYGVTGGEKFVLYLPNTPEEILDDNVHAYWPNEYMWRKKSINILYDYCLYNVNEGSGFFSDVFI